MLVERIASRYMKQASYDSERNAREGREDFEAALRLLRSAYAFWTERGNPPPGIGAEGFESTRDANSTVARLCNAIEDALRILSTPYKGLHLASFPGVVLPTKDLPPQIQRIVRSGPKVPREVHIESSGGSIDRSMAPFEVLFDLATGNSKPLKWVMPKDFRGDEDYYVGPHSLPLPAGHGYYHIGYGYPTLVVNHADFQWLKDIIGHLPEVSKQEWWALEAISTNMLSGRPDAFRVYKLGPYHPDNPYIKNLISKDLLTPALKITALGRSVVGQNSPSDLPDHPLPMPDGLVGLPKRRRWAFQEVRLDPRVKRLIAVAFKRAGLDGNGRFEKPSQGYSKAFEILGDFGMSLEDLADSHIFSMDHGSQRLRMVLTNPGDPFSPTPIKNSVLVISHYKMETDKFEVLAYLS